MTRLRDSNSGKNKKHFFLSKSPWPSLEPIYPPIQWVPWFFPCGWNCRFVMLTTLYHLTPRLRMSLSVPLQPPSPGTPSWCEQAQLHHFRIYSYKVCCRFQAILWRNEGSPIPWLAGFNNPTTDNRQYTQIIFLSASRRSSITYTVTVKQIQKVKQLISCTDWYTAPVPAPL